MMLTVALVAAVAAAPEPGAFPFAMPASSHIKSEHANFDARCFNFAYGVTKESAKNAQVVAQKTAQLCKNDAVRCKHWAEDLAFVVAAKSKGVAKQENGQHSHSFREWCQNVKIALDVEHPQEETPKVARALPDAHSQHLRSTTSRHHEVAPTTTTTAAATTTTSTTMRSTTTMLPTTSITVPPPEKPSIVAEPVHLQDCQCVQRDGQEICHCANGERIATGRKVERALAGTAVSHTRLAPTGEVGAQIEGMALGYATERAAQKAPGYLDSALNSLSSLFGSAEAASTRLEADNRPSH